MITFRICSAYFSVSCIKMGAALLIVFLLPACRPQICKAEEESKEDGILRGHAHKDSAPVRLQRPVYRLYSSNKPLFKRNQAGS